MLRVSVLRILLAVIGRRGARRRWRRRRRELVLLIAGHLPSTVHQLARRVVSTCLGDELRDELGLRLRLGLRWRWRVFELGKAGTKRQRLEVLVLG